MEVGHCLPEPNLRSPKLKNWAHDGRHHRGFASGPREPVVLADIKLASGPMDNGPLGILAIRNFKERKVGVFGGAREIFGWLLQQPLGGVDGMFVQGFFRRNEPLLSSICYAFDSSVWFECLFNDSAPATQSLFRGWEVGIFE